MLRVVAALCVVVAVVSGRTMDSGKGDAEVLFQGIHGPMMRLTENKDLGLPPGINEIDVDTREKVDEPLMDDSVNLLEEIEDLEEVVENAVEEFEEEFDEAEEDTLEGEEESDVEDTVEEEAEEDVDDADAIVEDTEDSSDADDEIFESGDIMTAMRRMYVALTERLSGLESRVSRVEDTVGDVVSRLTVVDCWDLRDSGHSSGVYTFHMDHLGKRPVSVMCDMDTEGGGWTVVQQRQSRSQEVDFSSRGWHDYKMGFGDATGDYWVGLENLFVWTNTRRYEARFELADFDGEEAWAQYDSFYVDGEDQAYRVHISGYSGTAGDAMTQEGRPDNFTADNMMFSTNDNDHDLSSEISCSKYWNIGGWWFNRCSWANLNGPYCLPGEGDGIGFNWHTWRNKQNLAASTIMIRPVQS